MKKSIIPLTLTVIFVACSREVPDSAPKPETLFLTAFDANNSKTIMSAEDYSVQWTQGDALSVFNTPSGMAQWSGNLEFKLDDAEAGRFAPASGVTVPLEEGVEYEWKAIYPYTAGLSHGVLPQIPFEQIQEGKNSTSHLGLYDIMQGAANSTRTPEIPMHHTGTLMKWTVRNDSEQTFTVSSISFFNGSDTYTLTVNGNPEMFPSSSADFYMVARPFAFAAGDEIKVSVVTSAGTETQIKKFSAARSFAAGQYNTATIICNPSELPASFSVSKDGDGKWRLYKNGEEFFIKGGAANNFYDKLATFGGNALRTYNISQLEPALAAAEATGVYVLAGITVGRERDGFDFGDAASIAAQRERVRSTVASYASNPYLIGWILGNELDSNYSDSRVWSVVEDLAQTVKSLDSYHLVTTALAGAKESCISEIASMAPSLDFISINSYYPAVNNIALNLSNYGWDKPWAVTEFGPRGTWNLNTSSEPPLTDWGACVEQTSSQKAGIYREILANVVGSNADNGCLGSFAFVWGYQNHGAVLTWYGLFDENGYSFAAVDELQYAWSGTYPANRAPVIEDRNSMLIDDVLSGDDNICLGAGSAHTASIAATSPCGAILRYKWLIVSEGATSLTGLDGLIQDDSASSISFRAPASNGEYRLIVFAYDDTNKKVASGVIPFMVEDNSIGMGTDEWSKGHEDFWDL